MPAASWGLLRPDPILVEQCRVGEHDTIAAKGEVKQDAQRVFVRRAHVRQRQLAVARVCIGVDNDGRRVRIRHVVLHGAYHRRQRRLREHAVLDPVPTLPAGLLSPVHAQRLGLVAGRARAPRECRAQRRVHPVQERRVCALKHWLRHGAAKSAKGAAEAVVAHAHAAGVNAVGKPGLLHVGHRRRRLATGREAGEEAEQ
eukprot:scaffold16237_cov72-Phaeocystis_antarctica.AAC.2